ncbi:MAG TPA: hypothetical protein VFX39_05285 [Gemmatimonadaceae bacterium]|nr:hypothetical protein [Gemmatimonadaceae bacterium]
MPSHLPGALRALLTGIVDYAGLFPPAGLGMDEAVSCFASFQAHPARWMLGRFVVPAERLDEFAAAATPHLRGGTRWRLTALVGPETGDDLARVAEFNCGTLADGAVIDAVEAKAAAPAGIERLAAAVPPGLTTFVEIPAAADPAPLVAALAASRLAAKVRTGGVTPDLFPTSAALARFVVACAAARVPFKATAGLHHPIRADYRLTYEPESASCTMFGFLNLFLAAALARQGVPEADVAQLLEEDDASSLSFTDHEARWRDHAVSTTALAETRARFAISFGSCSFTEPVHEVAALAGS